MKLQINQPCPESWEAMSLLTEGRHCASCQKIVQDFTQFSDAELVAWFGQSSGRTCGRLRTDQVDKVLRMHTAKRSGTSWLRWVVALVVGWQSVRGQSIPSGRRLTAANPPATSAPTRPATPQARPQQPVENDPVVFTINGRVTDVRKEPIQVANIVFKSTTRGCKTDHAGYFQLPVRKSDQTLQTRRLVVASIGYKIVELTVSTEKPPVNELSIQLVDDDTLLGEVVCVPDRHAGSSKRTSKRP